MQKRKQFTFYRSFYEALRDMPRELRLGALEAIIEFALDGKEPEGLEPMQRMIFTLIRPTLDSAKRMAEGGQKNKGKKRSAKATLNEKEEENENEGEDENEKEKENELEDECLSGDGFEKFWEIYPVRIGKGQAREEWNRLKPDTAEVLAGVRRWGGSRQWQQENGRFVPRAEKFLAQKQFLDDPPGYVPKGASGVLGKAEMEAIARLMEAGG